MQKELQQMMEADMSCWDDSSHTKTLERKWKPFPGFTIPVGTPRCQQLLDRVRDRWSTLQEKFGVEQLSQKLANLISVDTSEVEGVFALSRAALLSSGWRLTSVESASTDGSWLHSNSH